MSEHLSNIGTAIFWDGFILQEAQPLATGFSIVEGLPNQVLSALLDWTNGQPFFTQKLCDIIHRLAQESSNGKITVSSGNEQYWVEMLVKEHLLENWEAKDEPEHLRTISNRVLSHADTAGRLLGVDQQVLQGHDVISCADPISGNDISLEGQEEQDLILSGLVIKRNGKRCVKNRIYRHIFNENWVQLQLNLR